MKLTTEAVKTKRSKSIREILIGVQQKIISHGNALRLIASKKSFNRINEILEIMEAMQSHYITINEAEEMIGEILCR